MKTIVLRLLLEIPEIQANEQQIEQIVYRIGQIMSEPAYDQLELKQQCKLIKQVWPVAQYIDQDSGGG